jgi:hypothetical protein
MLLIVAGIGFGGYRFSITERGRDFIDGFRIGCPSSARSGSSTRWRCLRARSPRC